MRQQTNQLDGSHLADFVSRSLSGTIDGDAVRLRSLYTEENGDALIFTFSGNVEGDQIAGTLDMGEYLSARWIAKRRVHATA